LDEGYCSAALVEFDPDSGCNTYSPNAEASADQEWDEEEELEEWEEAEEDADDDDDDVWVDEEEEGY